MDEESKRHLRELAEGLKNIADRLMSEPNMSALERQNLGIAVGLSARGIEMALIIIETTPNP